MNTLHRSFLKSFLVLILFSSVILTANAATASFLKVYQATGTYSLKDLKLNITTAIVGSSFKFISVNPADATFSGNNIYGQLTYTAGGQSYTINGEITGKTTSSGGTTNGFYFFETSLLGGGTATGRAWVLVIPGLTVVDNSQLGGNSSGVGTDLESLRSTQSSNVAPVINTNGGGASAKISIAEGTTAVTTVTATDTNGNLNAAPYSITGGVDAAKFTINATTGALAFISAPDFEIPTDAGTNNVYDVQITATDTQGATDVQDIAVTITNVNDNAPVFRGLVSFTVLQNTTSVFTATATDGDAGTVLTYSITGGTNAALFTINSSSGALSFISNAVLGGPYQVNVQVSDGLYNTTETITVFVTSSDTYAPSLTITSSDNNLAANETCTLSFKFSELVQNFTLSDIAASGGTLGSTLSQSGTDATLYTVQFTKNSSAVSSGVSVAASSYQDMSNNNGLAASLNLPYDIVPPTVAITSENSQMAYGETQIITFTFSENIGNTFSTDDIIVTNGLFSNLLQDAVTPTKWTASLKAISSTANPTISVTSQSYSDLAGNPGAAAVLSITLAAPSIDLANTSDSDTGTSSIDNITSNRKPVLIGLAPASTTVSVTLIANSITYTYSVNVPASGSWSLDLNAVTGSPALPASGLPDGFVGVTITTAGGGATASSSFLVDTTAPAAPIVTELSTADNTPAITGTATIADTDILKVTVNGITYTLGDGNLTYNSVSKIWSLIVPDANTLVTGLYPVAATLYDAAGNNASNATVTNVTITANTWSGTGNWSSVANWSAGSLPNSYSDIMVASGSLTIDQNATVRNYTIGSSANVILGSGKNLTVNGDFVIKSDVNSTGTLLDNGGTLTVTGSTKVEQYLKSQRNWYVSSPVSLMQTSNVTSVTGNSLNSYAEPSGNWIATDNLFGVGKGYVINLLTDGNVIFTGGTLNTGDKTVNLTRSASNTSKPGFNLIGNPYPSYVNGQTAINSATNLFATMWYRTKNTSSIYVFDTFNASSGVGSNNNQSGAVTGIIPPMQAVWVRILDNQTSGSLTFNNSMRSQQGGTANRLKAPVAGNSAQQVLRLTVSNGNNSDEAIVLFNPNASNDLDTYDSPKMSNNNNSIPEIYTNAGAEKLVINGLKSVAENTVLPLGFSTGSLNTFTIKATEISNFGSDIKISLVDNISHIERDLTAGQDYTFSSDVATTTSRFSIQFKSTALTTGISNSTDNQNVKVVDNQNGKIAIYVTGKAQINGFVRVYNAVGQMLLSQKIENSENELSNVFTPGVYIVTVNLSGVTTTKKIVLD